MQNVIITVRQMMRDNNKSCSTIRAAFIVITYLKLTQAGQWFQKLPSRHWRDMYQALF